MRKEPSSDPEHLAALERLRAECAGWPGVSETTSWGNPTFKANGRTFAVLDQYRGRWCLCVRSSGARREALLAEEGWFAAPYDRKQQSLCRQLEGLDWEMFRAVLRESYGRHAGLIRFSPPRRRPRGAARRSGSRYIRRA